VAEVPRGNAKRISAAGKKRRRGATRLD